MLLKGGDVAYLGVLLGLNQLFIVLSSAIETNTIILLAGAALVVGIVIVEFGGKSGVVFYIASCILGFMLTFNKIEFVTYILFFGLYSIVKHLLESKPDKTILIYAAKLIFFNLSLAAMYFAVKLFIPLQLAWWMIVAAQLLFIIYDYAFAVFVTAYITHIRTKMRRG